MLQSLSVNMSARPLPESLQLKAENELNEVPSRVHEDIQHIRSWLEKQPHLKARTDDQWLLAFLRTSKFSIQRTKQKLDLYHAMRYLVPVYSINRDPCLPEIQEFLKRGILVPLPKTVASVGPRVFILRMKYLDPDIIPPVVMAKAVGMILDVSLMEDDNFVVAGQQVIIDMKDIPYMYVKLITPTLMKTWMTYLQNCYPSRPQSVHVINISPFAKPLASLIKQFAAKEFKNRYHFYTNNNTEDMYKYIPLSILPNEYGGEGGYIDKMIVQVKTKVESHREWLIEDAYYRSDETKRPGKPITSADMFGIEGSFRKLEID